MKTNFFKTALVALAAISTLACSDDDNNSTLREGVNEVISQNATITIAESPYYLDGELKVTNGATLTIEPGVKIIARQTTETCYILVERGSKIVANGTAALPIIMTSEIEERGAWGGIHICGYAQTNVANTTLSEVGDSPYGGEDDTDSSGSLKYVIIEYSGQTLGVDKEANGFTFYGVGSGTTVEYCASYMGKDDGFEFFGGTVEGKYLVSIASGDDSFDWTEGYRGKGQFWIADQIGVSGDRTVEADNNSTTNDITPNSNPTLANLTLIGSYSSSTNVNIRVGSGVKMYNTLVGGNKTSDLVLTSQQTNALFNDGTANFSGVYLNGSFKYDDTTDYTVYTTFAGVTANYATAFTYASTVEGAGSVATATQSDNFFEDVTYAGAGDIFTTSGVWGSTVKAYFN